MTLMSPVDLALLAAEIGSRTLHIGVLLVFAPPPDGRENFAEAAYREALTAVTAQAALMAEPVISLKTGGLPAWEPADHIDMARHLRRLALPHPGDDTELFELVARLHESRLDRSRPMWEGYLIEGLADGRFALYGKIHHATLDGMSGIRMIEQSLSPDADRRGMALLLTSDAPQPSRERGFPNPFELVRDGVAGALSTVNVARRTTVGALDWLGKAVTTDSTPLPMQAPRTRFDGKVGPERSFVGRSWPKERLRAVQRATGASGNEVTLAMCAGALRGYLLERDALPSDSLIAMVPIAQRQREDATGGNSLGLALCTLGTDLAEPRARLERIRQSMADAKRRVREMGYVASMIASIPALAPNVARMLPTGTLTPPSYNVVISNVPGPTKPLFWNGAALQHMYPLSIVFDGTGLNITICHYADRLDFGFLAHPESAPELERFTDETETALGDLERISKVHST
ncbi:wax ester/triacylglycerol synthase family O-acyltransferase [Rhodococcus sp. ABRD24]|uniref:wax ester/triacylglycerol synthase family O-acyltransferase n=1 Tax=Rhodococcus sp. ABRD24 TaxID=2507582 RepID=UPI00103E48C8|nr:wax ester/triacylglycerol synthase family O-acyltransferase [Rhodococcus sp. ABRD24]QBJ96667.1 wax ester/triacylglycerol synthase family O-acyltransferase [Rhodococcus sp. ABRD24]